MERTVAWPSPACPVSVRDGNGTLKTSVVVIGPCYKDVGTSLWLTFSDML